MPSCELKLAVRAWYLGWEIERGELDEGAVAGDLVDNEVGVAVLEDATEAGEALWWGKSLKDESWPCYSAKIKQPWGHVYNKY